MTAAEAILRPAAEHDLDELVRVYIAAYGQPPWNERGDPIQSRGYVEWVMGQPNCQCIVAVPPGVPDSGVAPMRGMLLSAPREEAEFHDDWQRLCDPLPQGWPPLPPALGGIGYVYELAIDPPWQGCGLGGRLLDAAIQAFHEAGAAIVALRSSEIAPVAVRLYESRGFQRWPLRERGNAGARWWWRSL